MADIKETFIQLGWEILEHKFAYYHPDKLHPSWKASIVVPDEVYDAKEADYRDIAKALSLPPTAADAVDFPIDKPCGRLVMSKLTKRAR